MSVALRFALREGAAAEVGALLTMLPALAILLVFAAAHGLHDVAAAWPFALAGLVAPGGSQILFTLAVRDAGPSRTSVLVGTAPLFSVAIALALLDESLRAALLLGAVLIVAGGLLLVAERDRPAHFKLVGLGFAAAATVVFAVRDNFVRWLAIDTSVHPALAAAATLGAGGACVLVYLLVRGRRLSARAVPAFLPAGVLFGLSYV